MFKNIKIKRKWIILAAVILLFVGYLSVKSFFKSPTEGYSTEKISRGDVLQQISETGSVKATESASLAFKGTGRITNINVAVGDNVKKGDTLAQLDCSQAKSQLYNAQSGLNAAASQYQKLVNGSTSEDIKTVENTVVSAKNDLAGAYDSALNTLNDAYAKMYNADSQASSIQLTYFMMKDQAGVMIAQAKDTIKDKMIAAKTLIESAKADGSYDKIDLAVSGTKSALNIFSNNLKIIREQCEKGVYYADVTSADKTAQDTQIGYINTAAAAVVSAQQSISSYKIALQKAQDNLALKIAGPRDEDVDIYRAQMQQAQANVGVYQSQVEDCYLRSPIDAKITNINGKTGESVSPTQAVVNLLSLDPFQIKVDIYEQDIVNIRPGNEAEITLVAFPKQKFLGKVLSIDPAEKIVDNVVYYEVTIDFPNQPDGIRSGMTADIVVLANKAENVLRVPKGAVEDLGEKKTVQVVNKGKIETREIKTALEGDEYFEVVSGLHEGDEVITGKK